MAGLFQVLWATPEGEFKPAEALLGTDGEPLILPTPKGEATEGKATAGEATAVESDDTSRICTRPMAVDWDGDGELDLVVGNFAGKFFVFHGEGAGRFQAEGQPLMLGDKPLKLPGGHGDPFPIDWDGDGDLDLLSGSASGGVRLATNNAGPGKPPELKRFARLISSAHGMSGPGQLLDEKDLKGPAVDTRVWADDVNGDGKLDLLVGDSVTLVSMAEGLSQEEFETKKSEWERAWQEVLQETIKAARPTAKGQAKLEVSSESREKMSQLYEKRAEFLREERTGFVWLYLGK